MAPKKSTSKSSKRWLNEHFKDPYVKQAQQTGYRSRAVYKLIEINERDRIFKPGMVVVDLGAAPGSWSQYVAQQIGKNGKIFALDILNMDPIPNVRFIQGDFNDENVVQQFELLLDGNKVDLVLSDIAPNMSGVPSVDQARSLNLAEMALDFSIKVLKPDGSFLIKLFQGEGYEAFLKIIRSQFKKVVIRKPKASRGRSSEVYILAKELTSS